METNTQRKWYTKKRFIIPGIIIAGFIAIAVFSDPSTQDVKNQEGEIIEIKQIAPTSETKQEAGIPEPENVVEEKQKETEPESKIIPFSSFKASKEKETSSCDSNYSGCVPIASDVDCAGGSGNGPEYVRGPVNVIGNDIYGLDRDGDGTGCD